MRAHANGDAVINLPITSPIPVVAVGGELKSALCVLEGSRACLELPRGDLSQAENLRGFVLALQRRLTHVGSAVIVAHDLHPAYLATQYARRLARDKAPMHSTVQLHGVQHHYAHVLSCMAEHGVTAPVIGLACDGTGYGIDGAVWGCEVLQATPLSFVRRAHLRYFPLLGGDAAARETWRPALALLWQAFGESIPARVIEKFRCIPHKRFVHVLGLLRQVVAGPPTSSLGRLFDAVAFLTGLAMHNDEEGYAARMLEEVAGGGRGPCYGSRLTRGPAGLEIDVRGMIRQIAHEAADGLTPVRMSQRFHATVARALADAAWNAARENDLGTVVLSGGCFANRLLTGLEREQLEEHGIGRVLVHERVSCGDAGLALGQAFGAASAAQARRAD